MSAREHAAAVQSCVEFVRNFSKRRDIPEIAASESARLAERGDTAVAALLADAAAAGPLREALVEIEGDGYCSLFTAPHSCLTMDVVRRCDSCIARAALALPVPGREETGA